MLVKLNTTNHRTCVFLQRSTASMSIDKMDVTSTTPSYGIAFEIPYQSEWEAFLTESKIIELWEIVDIDSGKQRNYNGIPISGLSRGEKKIILYTNYEDVIWIGKWFADWKAGK